jgi:Domain of unknown function (DUF4386)
LCGKDRESNLQFYSIFSCFLQGRSFEEGQPMFNWTFVLSKFIVAGNEINTAHNILSNEFLFRTSIINDLLASIIAVLLGWTLFVILKTVNKNLALLGLILKLTEAILIAVIALGDYVVLQILKDQASLTVFEPVQIQVLAGLLLMCIFLYPPFQCYFLE